MSPIEIQNALKKIEQLVREANDNWNTLRSSVAFPRDIEVAITERLGNTFPVAIGTGTATTQSVSVPSTPVNITVPAQPSGTVKLQINGTIYEVLYK